MEITLNVGSLAILRSAVEMKSGCQRKIPSTVPYVEHQVPEELEGAAFDPNGGCQAAHVFGHVITEDDTSH